MPGKAIILLQENSGKLAFFPDEVPAPIRAKIEELIDTLAETTETLKNSLQANGKYDVFINLTDSQCTRQNLLDALIEQTQSGRTIDLVTLGHGSNDRLVLHDESLTSRTIRSLLTDAQLQDCPSLNLRTVFMCNCYGSTLNDAWIEIGAQASVGAYRNNYMPEPMTSYFLNDWVNGYPVIISALRAYTATQPFYAPFALASPEVYSESVQVVGGDGNITFAWEYSSADFYEQLGTNPITSGPGVCSSASGQLDVFVRGTDDTLYRKSFDGRWSGYEQLGANPITSDPTAVSWGDGRIDVLVRGTDGALYHKWFDGNWSDYEQLGTNPITSGPAVCSWASGRLDVFVRGTDGTLYHKWFDGNWSDYEQLGANPIASDPAAVSWGDGRIDVFVRGTDATLYHKWFDGNWSDYEQLGTNPITSGPGACSPAPGRLDVFVRGTDDALYHKWFDGNWSDYEQLGANPIASDPAAVSWGDGRIDVFVRGTDATLYHKWFDGVWRP